MIWWYIIERCGSRNGLKWWVSIISCIVLSINGLRDHVPHVMLINSVARSVVFAWFYSHALSNLVLSQYRSPEVLWQVSLAVFYPPSSFLELLSFCGGWASFQFHLHCMWLSLLWPRFGRPTRWAVTCFLFFFVQMTIAWSSAKVCSKSV